MEKALRAFGPMTAGLHVFAQITLIVELGIIGNWVRDYWLPATRLFWQKVFESLSFIDIDLTDPEKDSLTAVAFFLPLAISSVVLRFSASELTEDDEKPKKITIYSMRFAASICAVLILFFVSRQIVSDAEEIFKKTGEGYERIELFSMFSILGFGLLTILLVAFYRIELEIRRYLLIFGATIGAILEIILIGAPVFIAGYVSVVQLGLIRSAAILLVTFCIVMTIVVRPQRMFQVAMVVGVLIIAGAIWDIVENVRDEIEKPAQPTTNAPPKL